MTNRATATPRPDVSQAKAALREFAGEADAKTFGPALRRAGVVAAGIAVTSLILGRTRTLVRIVQTGLRLAPTLIKYL